MNPEDKRFAQSGRNTFSDGVLYLGWSGSCLECVTNSPEVTFDLVTDELPLAEGHLGRAAVYVDGQEERTLLLRGEERVTVRLTEGSHRVSLVKLSEAAFGLVGVRNVSFRPPREGTLTVRAPEKKPRRIEFIGDSITCGYGIEGADENEPFTTGTEHPLKGYAGLAARALDAEAEWISWSGIGVLSHYVPPEVNEPREEFLMGQLYPFEDLRLDTRRGICPRLRAERFRPQLIVIHLGTNDDSFVRGDPAREAVFGRRYRALLDTVHAMNPQAALLCCLGLMGTRLCPETERQTLRFAREHPSCTVLFHGFEEQDGARDGYGCDFHPSARTHIAAAREIEEVIRSMMGWGKTEHA